MLPRGGRTSRPIKVPLGSCWVLLGTNFLIGEDWYWIDDQPIEPRADHVIRSTRRVDASVLFFFF